jgi:pyruvate dehydrogenase E2 component (dihydrolipoamide acetyltransferase)
MPIKVLMPALSPTMTSGNLAKWLKKEGDVVKPGMVLAEIETDKATMELEAVDEGILAKILISDGSEGVDVNSLIAIILEDGEDASAVELIMNSVTDSQKIATESGDESDQNQLEVGRDKSFRSNDTDIGKSHDHRVFASPLAKRLASQKNIDLSKINGSGPYGRIVKNDILSYSSESNKICARNSDEFYTKKHTNIGKIIAKRLSESKQTIPHFYLTIECALEKLLALRSDINSAAGDKYRLSVNDFIIKAVSLSMQHLPMINASWSDENMIIYNNIDISVAVASEHGLITPVIRNANFKSVDVISGEMKDLVKKARENKLRPEEFQGGGFTISNLGMYGIKNFGAIINPPQSCILAVGEGVKKPIVDGDKIKVETVMEVTLSCDHRVVDGALGAEFLKKFKWYIEHPSIMLLK